MSAFPFSLLASRSALLAFLFLLATPLLAQIWENSGADAVESFRPGTEQSSGQEAEYFPKNVLGLPDPTAREWTASIDPVQILSIGMGGEITLRFDRSPIVDIPGPDFTVFENAFRYTLGGREGIYAEPAIVSVSRDGVQYYSFPFDSLTLVGLAGVTPTNGDRDPGDPTVSGGNSFDLHYLGIDSVRYVRLTDITHIVRNNKTHPFWDPTLSGFDLDAVVRVTRPMLSSVDDIDRRDGWEIALAPNPIRSTTLLRLHVPMSSSLRVSIVDAIGQRVVLWSGNVTPGIVSLPIDGGNLDEGFGVIVVESNGSIVRTMATRVMR